MGRKGGTTKGGPPRLIWLAIRVEDVPKCVNDLAHSPVVQSPDNPRLKVEILLLYEGNCFTLGNAILKKSKFARPKRNAIGKSGTNGKIDRGT